MMVGLFIRENVAHGFLVSDIKNNKSSQSITGGVCNKNPFRENTPLVSFGVLAIWWRKTICNQGAKALKKMPYTRINLFPKLTTFILLWIWKT